MFSLAKRPPKPVINDDGNLSDLLGALLGFGTPTLYWSKHMSGWVCWVDMNTTAEGSEFKIKSEYHPDPLKAALECQDRIKDVMGGSK